MESVEQTLDRLVTPDFTQRINAQVYRRSEYAAHVREMRRLVAGGGEMRVLEQVHAGESIAGRYLFRMVSADGQETIGESHLFARLRDGRVARFVEVARWVEGADDEDYLSD
jgi:hypothetical protein